MKQPLEVLPYLNLFGSSKQSVSLPSVKALLSLFCHIISLEGLF
jgi:hypothetical protein